MHISLAPETLFIIWGIPITNTLLATVTMTGILILIIFIIRISLQAIPNKIQNIFEVFIEQGFNFVKTVIPDQEKAKKIFPLIFSIFLFVLIANLIPFSFPGQSALTYNKNGEEIPIFRAIMSDYSMVLVLTLIIVIITQIIALKSLQPTGYIKKFINIKGFFHFGTHLSQGKIKLKVLAQAFLDLFLGFMDILGEFMKIVSMSFRLFGNIFAGEVLITVILSLAPFFAPLPFMFLGFLAAIIQAFVFAMLTLISISMAMQEQV